MFLFHQDPERPLHWETLARVADSLAPVRSQSREPVEDAVTVYVPSVVPNGYRLRHTRLGLSFGEVRSQEEDWLTYRGENSGGVYITQYGEGVDLAPVISREHTRAVVDGMPIWFRDERPMSLFAVKDGRWFRVSETERDEKRPLSFEDLVSMAASLEVASAASAIVPAAY